MGKCTVEQIHIAELEAESLLEGQQLLEADLVYVVATEVHFRDLLKSGDKCRRPVVRRQAGMPGK
jgi:hypothetical protein